MKKYSETPFIEYAQMGDKKLAILTGWSYYRGKVKFNDLSRQEWQMHYTSHSHFLNNCPR